MPASTKVKDDDDSPTKEDIPTGDKKTALPKWAKCIIGINLVAVHVVVVLTGIEDINFTLGDGALAAYIVTGLGAPIGLAHQAVRHALASLFGIKS